MNLRDGAERTFTFHEIFKEAVGRAITSNRERGIPNFSIKENWLVMEYMNEEVRYTGEVSLEEWIATSCNNIDYSKQE